MEVDPTVFATISLSEMNLLESHEVQKGASETVSDPHGLLHEDDELKPLSRVRKGYSGRSSKFLQQEVVMKQKLRGASGANLPKELQTKQIHLLDLKADEPSENPQDTPKSGKDSTAIKVKEEDEEQSKNTESGNELESENEDDYDEDSDGRHPRLSSGDSRRPRYWTAEEDATLAAAVEAHGEKMWKKIASMVPNRTSTQCIQRWKKVLKPGLKKGHWSTQEDALLVQSVQAQVEKQSKKINWSEVSKNIPKRSCKQCRERWVNHLNPDVNKGSWTDEEDKLLWELQEKTPRKWALIARSIPGRTENMVKVRWNILSRSRAEMESTAQEGAVSVSPRPDTVSSTAVRIDGTPWPVDGPEASSVPHVKEEAAPLFDTVQYPTTFGEFGGQSFNTQGQQENPLPVKKEHGDDNFDIDLLELNLLDVFDRPEAASAQANHLQIQHDRFEPTFPNYSVPSHRTMHMPPPAHPSHVDGYHSRVRPIKTDFQQGFGARPSFAPPRQHHQMRPSFTAPEFPDYRYDQQFDPPRSRSSMARQPYSSYVAEHMQEPAPSFHRNEPPRHPSPHTHHLGSISGNEGLRGSARDYQLYFNESDQSVPTFDEEFMSQGFFSGPGSSSTEN